MTKLHGVISDRPELVFISDRCTAIKRAVLKAFHTAAHGVCFYHVKGNIKSKFRMSKAIWDQFERAFINAVKAYGHEEFKRQLEGLWMLHSGAADYLENNVGTCNWPRSEFEGRRYSILTTNIVTGTKRLAKCTRVARRLVRISRIACASHACEAATSRTRCASRIRQPRPRPRDAPLHFPFTSVSLPFLFPSLSHMHLTHHHHQQQQRQKQLT